MEEDPDFSPRRKPDSSSSEDEAHRTGQTKNADGMEKRTKRVSRAKRMWARSGLDVPTLLMMFKYVE